MVCTVGQTGPDRTVRDLPMEYFVFLAEGEMIMYCSGCAGLVVPRLGPCLGDWWAGGAVLRLCLMGGRLCWAMLVTCCPESVM